MTNEGRNQTRKRRVYKVILILLVALSTISGARKDLNQLLSLVNDMQSFTDKWFGGMFPTAHAGTVYKVETCSNNEKSQSRSDDEFRWTGRISQGKAIEVKGISGNISAEPASGDQVEVVANKSGRESDLDNVKVQFIEHQGGVTICAIYASEDSTQTNTCEPGTGNSRNSSSRNNDVRVDFKVRVPVGVVFVGRTVNGEIKAASLSSNVVSHTVNGSIQISTSGYAEAKTVNGEILVSVGNGNWPQALEFKTVNGGITLDLPPNLSTRVTADTFNGNISSDFPITSQGTMSRKHLSGTIGSGGRELILKTLNGSINLRRAG